MGKQNLIKKAELARLAGVSRAAIVKQCPKRFKAALVADKIDVNHPIVKDYLAEKGKSAPKAAPAHKKPKPKANVGARAQRDNKKAETVEIVEGEAIPENIQALADMTLREVIDRFGSDYALLDYLKSVKTIEDIHEKRLKNAEKAGDLISRAAVTAGFLSPVDEMMERMLNDGAKAISQRVHNLSKSGATLKESRDLVVDLISSFFKPMKAKVARTLKNLENENAIA